MISHYWIEEPTEQLRPPMTLFFIASFFRCSIHSFLRRYHQCGLEYKRFVQWIGGIGETRNTKSSEGVRVLEGAETAMLSFILLLQTLPSRHRILNQTRLHNCCYIIIIVSCTACAVEVKSNKWWCDALSVISEQQRPDDRPPPTPTSDNNNMRGDNVGSLSLNRETGALIFSCSALEAFSWIRDTVRSTPLPRSLLFW